MKEFSYGIIPIRKEGKEWKVLLIQHSRAKFWGYPKGHAEAGESPIEAAKRELYEETQLQVVRLLSESAIEENYLYKLRGTLRDKTVYLFPAIVEGTVKLQEEEVSGAEWHNFDAALSRITYEADRAALSAVKDLLGI